VKKLLEFIFASLFVVLHGFAMDAGQIHSFTKSSHQKTSLENPSRDAVGLASQPEYLINIVDSSSFLSLKDSGNDGWTSIKVNGYLFTVKCSQYLNFSRRLTIPFNISDIIFPFHYHW